MRIPNMCLVLKLDNGKVVFIASGQSDRVTEPSSTVLVYRYIYTGYISHLTMRNAHWKINSNIRRLNS